MKLRRLFVISLLGLLAFSGCSYEYRLQAVERDGRIVFQPEQEHGTGCLSNFIVTSRNGDTMWSLDSGAYTPSPCQSLLPLTYGIPPKGMTEKVKAKPLQPGAVYIIEGWDGDSYKGAFSFRPSIEIDNLEG